MKTRLFTLFLFGTIVATAAGHVGEAYADVIRRYGEPIDPDKSDHDLRLPVAVEIQTFRYRKWTIEIVFYHGRSASERYSKPWPRSRVKADPRVRGELFQNDLDLVLGVNSRRKDWRSVGAIDYKGKSRPLGSYEAPCRLVNAWVLTNEPLIAVHERRDSGDGTHVDYVEVLTTEWNEHVSRRPAKKLPRNS